MPRRSPVSSFQRVHHDLSICTGGIDLLTPTLRLRPGMLIVRDGVNWEASASPGGGYTRIGGYERFDGQTKPSDATYQLLQVSAFDTIPTVGTIVTGLVSRATGKVIATGANYLILTQVTGTFDAGELYYVDTLTLADNFNRVDESPVTGWTASTRSPSLPALHLVSNRIEGPISATENSQMYATAFASATNQEAAVTVGAVGTDDWYGAILVGLDDPSKAYVVGHSHFEVEFGTYTTGAGTFGWATLFSFDTAGTWTPLGDSDVIPAFQASDTIRLWIAGTRIRVLVNNRPILDREIPAGFSIGLYGGLYLWTSTAPESWALDDWSTGTSYDIGYGASTVLNIAHPSVNTTAVNDPTRGVTGPIASFSAMTFDGTNDYLSVSTPDVPSDPGTLEFWVKFPTGYTGSAGILGKGGPPWEYAVWKLASDQKLRFAQWVTSGASTIYTDTSQDILADDQWHHYVWTLGATNAYLYVDGVLVNTVAISAGDYTPSTQLLEIGRAKDSGGTYYLTGSLAHVALYGDSATDAHLFTASDVLRHLAAAEGPHSNLLLQSEDLSHASWNAHDGVTITPNATTAPNGTATADKVAEDASTGFHRAGQSFAAASFKYHTQYVVSTYAKAVENTSMYLTLEYWDTAANRGSGVLVGVDLTDGSIVLDYGQSWDSDDTETWHVVDATTEDVGNGWYRVLLTCVTNTSLSDSVSSFSQVRYDPLGSQTYTGTPGNGVYLWGTQITETPTIFFSEQGSEMVADQSALTGTTNAPSKFIDYPNLVTTPQPRIAYGFVENEAPASVHQLAKGGLPIQVNTRYRISFYAKAGTVEQFDLAFEGLADGVNLSMNLSTGEVYSFVSWGGGTWTAESITVTPEDHGWYHITLSCISGPTETEAALYLRLAGIANGARDVVYDGRGSAYGAYLYQILVTEGDTYTSYIPTTTTAYAVTTYEDELWKKISGIDNTILLSGYWPLADAVENPVTLTAEQNAQYLNLSADQYRAVIQAVPGAGPVRGVVSLNAGGVHTVYAFRNNAGQTACAIYKSTSSGWSLVALLQEVAFTAGGTTQPAEGTTLTQGANTATIRRVVHESGSWGSNTAAGRFIIETPAPGNFSAGAATIGAITVTLSGANSAISLLPNGIYQFDVKNFGGQLTSKRIYGCDSVNRAFEFDGTIIAPIETKAATDTPSYVRIHRQHLFVGLGSSLMISGPGVPYKFNASDGGAEIATGDGLTGMLSLPGASGTATMLVDCRNSKFILYGTSGSGSDAWRLVDFNNETGGVAYSQQVLADAYSLDDTGVQSLRAASELSGFAPSTMTHHLQPYLDQRRGALIDSCVHHAKSQYRLFFNDGSALWLTILNGKLSGAMAMLFPDPFFRVWNAELPSGEEVTYAGATDGYVYQLDKGTSFDGDDIIAPLRLSHIMMKSPRLLKRYRKASLELTSNYFAKFDFGYSVAYGSTLRSQPSALSYKTNLSGIPTWDTGFWDTGLIWDGRTLSPTEIAMMGTGENVEIVLSAGTDYLQPFTVNSLLIHYTLRRALR